MIELISIAAELIKIGVEYGIASAARRLELVASAKSELAKAGEIVAGLDATIAAHNLAADAKAAAKDQRG